MILEDWEGSQMSLEARTTHSSHKEGSIPLHTPGALQDQEEGAYPLHTLINYRMEVGLVVAVGSAQMKNSSSKDSFLWGEEGPSFLGTSNLNL